ncbi:hypothetical protein SASPL_129517 [Salvia splendens]|uniref:Uncharacterized protein n=1 Tax=Salvia splendens TaxID=180675 RepID=A0A8X8XBG2_SALSN|nr:uncharacterized protein LOC121752501 [Salvia splendens]KAG6411435.1 hypothetical protein SASPL_129517 [Salvia splendens]
MESDESTAIPIQWSHEANWIIAHGSLQSTVTVDSSDHPIAEPDSENTATKFPLILKPPSPDFGHCEIKICFKQKYEVRQIYVRSTARAYEIYYATSPNSINEYLSTVRCGVAERDDKVLQTSCVEDFAEVHGDSLSGDVAAETASSGGSTATSEDDWVNIKVPGRSSPASDKTSTVGVNNVQDFYEATAQISDSEPCLSLTIRLLSLHDKGHVYVDEVYVFVDPVESTDSGNGAALAGGLAQSSLMAMFMPTLLQLSKSGVSRAQEKSDEVLKNRNMELVSTTTDRIDSPQQVLKPKEVCKDDTESAEHQQHTSAKKYCMAANESSFQPSHLETAMEQLVSRLSRVEVICLRFEEKMLKPIERIEERLQQVENQLEKLSKSSHEFGLPHCTRISAPAFSCSGSDTSSFYNNELEKKDFTSDDLPDSLEANFNPGLIITAPEFSYEEDEDNDDLKPLEDSLCVEPKKTLSIDDALAAALNGFMSSEASEPIPIPIGLLGDENEEIQYQGHAKFCQTETREFPAAESGSTESSQNVQVFTIEAPDFTLEETGSEEQLNSVQSLFDVASVTEKEKVDFGNEMVPLSNNSADTSDVGIKESTDELGSPFNGNSPTSSNGCLNRSSTVNVIETYFEGNTTSGRDEITSSSAPSPAKDSTDTSMHQISDESNLGKLSSKPDDQDAASQEIIGQEAEIASESEQQNVAIESSEDHDAEHVSGHSNVASFLDFELPILEVKFTSELRMSAKSALEALLDDEASESNTEAPLTDTKKDDGICIDGHETIDVLSKNCLLVDLEVSEDTAVSSHLEGAASHSLSPTSCSEMAVSLI